MRQSILYSLLIGLLACGQSQSQSGPKRSSALPSSEFKEYWYQGKAELTSYNLKQARYGEIREGTAVAIFVTEDFSRSKKVKLDNPSEAGNDAVNVMKFNLSKSFNTGIYTYSLMQSVFKPVKADIYPNTLRVTTSNQEWCGQFLTRTELTGNQYQIKYNSYFEGEEDKTVLIDKSILEDELWIQVRFDPKQLPVGEHRIIPSILTRELIHQEIRPELARAKLTLHDSIPDASTYHIVYPEIDRELKIHFLNDYPHYILGWEETFHSGFGPNRKKLTTSAWKIEHTLSDYWDKNSNEYEVLRKTELGLDE
jgi:hypothetical protein